MESVNSTKRKNPSSVHEENTVKRAKTAWTTTQQPTPDTVSRSSREPTPSDDDYDNSILAGAARTLAIEAAALASVSARYHTDAFARQALLSAVNKITAALRRRNKLIFCAVGKSAYIAQKLVATCKSLGIRCSFLHACEAVHGDLGDIESDDIVLFVTYSGRTPELLNLLPHLPRNVQLMALCGKTKIEDCRLLDNSTDGILLPAPVHESEEASFGVLAPTTSTTVAIAVGDMLALAVAEQLHGNDKRQLFQRNHPGGAIGQQTRVMEVVKEAVAMQVIELPSPTISAESED